MCIYRSISWVNTTPLAWSPASHRAGRTPFTLYIYKYLDIYMYLYIYMCASISISLYIWIDLSIYLSIYMRLVTCVASRWPHPLHPVYI